MITTSPIDTPAAIPVVTLESSGAFRLTSIDGEVTTYCGAGATTGVGAASARGGLPVITR